MQSNKGQPYQTCTICMFIEGTNAYVHIYLNFLRSTKGRRKKNELRTCAQGGGANTLSSTKLCFFFIKEKNMQNVLKRKNMYLEVFRIFPLKITCYDHSESIDKRIEKWLKKIYFFTPFLMYCMLNVCFCPSVYVIIFTI